MRVDDHLGGPLELADRLLDKPRLSDAGHAVDQHRGSFPRARPIRQGPEPPQFVVPAHESLHKSSLHRTGPSRTPRPLVERHSIGAKGVRDRHFAR